MRSIPASVAGFPPCRRPSGGDGGPAARRQRVQPGDAGVLLPPGAAPRERRATLTRRSRHTSAPSSSIRHPPSCAPSSPASTRARTTPLEAIANAEAALARDPANPEANRILGTVYAEYGERRMPMRPGDDPSTYPARAIAALEKARGDGSDIGVELPARPAVSADRTSSPRPFRCSAASSTSNRR